MHLEVFVRLPVCALIVELFDLPVQGACLCVCNQGVYANNHAVAVDRLLINVIYLINISDKIIKYQDSKSNCWTTPKKYLNDSTLMAHSVIFLNNLFFLNTMKTWHALAILPLVITK